MTSTETLVFQPREAIAGKYEVLKHLGEGGLGVVVSARHRDLDTRVAIRVVRPEYAQNEQVVARMLLEARSAAKIRSEHVCKVLDVGRLETGVPYIVMEYLDGQDLGRALAQQGKLPLQTAIDYVLQACEALAEAHTAQIVHRDLKPENLFLAHQADGSAQVKVLDFGISKSLKTDDRASALTNPSSAAGSPFYMSPEQMPAPRDRTPSLRASFVRRNASSSPPRIPITRACKAATMCSAACITCQRPPRTQCCTARTPAAPCLASDVEPIEIAPTSF